MNLNEKFDVIYANLSLHYFNDKITTEIFSNLVKLLNQDGYLFVRCKSVEDPLYGIGNEIEINVFDNKGKIQHLFSKEYLKEKLKDYSIIRIRRTSSKHLTMEKGVIEFLEPTDSGKYNREEFEISHTDIIELKKTIEKVVEEIKTLAFWNKICDDKDCQYCAYRKLIRS